MCTFQRAFVSFLSIGLLTFAAVSAKADHHTAGEIEGAVRAFHQDINQGDFDAMFAKFAPGMSAFLPYGLLKELPDDATKAMVLQLYKQAYEDGFRAQLMPQYIKVSVHGDCAIATFLREGTITESEGEEENDILERGTFVWLKIDDKWLVAHVHVSELEKPEDDD